MNRKMRREMARREKADETASLKQLMRSAERTIKKVVKQERQAVTDQFGLDKDGKGFEEYHTSTNTLGSVACMYSGDLNGDHVKYAAITATAANRDVEPAFIDQLTRSYENLDMTLLKSRGEKRIYFGDHVKVVLSQIRGDLWTVYLGSEGLIDRFIETGSIAVVLAASGYSAFWNEWEVRVDDGRLAMWENLMRELQAVFFHALEWPHLDGKVMPGFDMFIPSENVIIQREGEAKIPYGRQAHPTSPRRQD